jgi:hypothetical protein
VTDADLAGYVVRVAEIEVETRAHWDAIASGTDAEEYRAAMGAVRQAGALRRALEQLIVVRATRAQRAATSR